MELARELGDQRHQAELLWKLAIQNAEVGEREQALAFGLESTHIMEKMGNPHAFAFAKHLEKYRLDANTGCLQETTAIPALTAGYSQVFSLDISANLPADQNASHGPGLLRMASSAAKAAARYVGSGMKRVSGTTYKKRVEICATCPNHTGVRCKSCGCFTSVKAWLPHEKCPVGKWDSD